MKRKIIAVNLLALLFHASAFPQMTHKIRIRPAIRQELTVAEELAKEGDYERAMALVDQSAATPNQTADEKDVIAQMRRFVLVKSGNGPKRLRSWEHLDEPRRLAEQVQFNVEGYKFGLHVYDALARYIFPIASATTLAQYKLAGFQFRKLGLELCLCSPIGFDRQSELALGTFGHARSIARARDRGEW